MSTTSLNSDVGDSDVDEFMMLTFYDVGDNFQCNESVTIMNSLIPQSHHQQLSPTSM